MSSVMNAIRVPASELSGVEKSAPQEHNFAISYLRAFITVPVLAHHAVLAYCTFVPPPPAALNTGSLWWSAFRFLWWTTHARQSSTCWSALTIHFSCH